jgi:flagellar biosynthesis GTPase FlhF
VTAHLAALARADRTKLPPRAAAPARRGEPAAWSPDFPHLGTEQELGSADASELFSSPQPRASAPVQQAPLQRAPAERAPAERAPAERAPVARAPAPPWATGERREVAPGSHSRARAGVARSLQRCGIGEELTRELIDGASAHALALAPRAGLAQAVRVTLAQRIPVAAVLPTKGAAIVVVGAGGAGKTTCCATLLGAYRKHSTLPASFATVTRNPDGAADRERGELRMILSPYVMKPTPARAQRVVRALRRARGDGVAVLDTPSVSPSDRAGIRELARLLAELQPDRVVVALPATLGATAAAQLLQALHPLGADAMAVTHADETDQLGVAVEAACRFGLAPEYMLERVRAGGWRLRQISPTALAERLLP